MAVKFKSDARRRVERETREAEELRQRRMRLAYHVNNMLRMLVVALMLMALILALASCAAGLP